MLKRTLDIVASVLLLIMLTPFILLLILMVRVLIGRPVFFRQTRPGMNGKPFSIIKLRTMVDRYDTAGAPLPDNERLGWFGKLLRSTSLDELPELWNVLKGDMSLVGPRPLLMQYLPLYNARQARRHEVRPGITGWAQINGRNAVTWEEKFEMDVWYVDNQSLALDLKILARTVWKVLARDGISAPGHATADFFRGSPPETTPRQNSSPIHSP